jgi:hypothetical protein
LGDVLYILFMVRAALDGGEVWSGLISLDRNLTIR